MTKQPYHGDSGNDPLRPECSSPHFGGGEVYHCHELSCPIHGERNKQIASVVGEDCRLRLEGCCDDPACPHCFGSGIVEVGSCSCCDGDEAM